MNTLDNHVRRKWRRGIHTPRAFASPATARLAVLIVLLASLSSCMLFRLHRDVTEIDATGTVAGFLQRQSDPTAPVRVLLYRVEQGEHRLAQWTTRRGSTDFYYFLITQPGDYVVAAFEDANEDLTWGSGERGGVLQGFAPLAVKAKDRHRNRNIALTMTGPRANLNTALKDSGVEETVLMGVVGEVVTLDEPVFSRATADAGLWQPLTVLKKHGFGIYMLEEYDPKRVPVIFVHGSSGTAREFKFLLEGLGPSFQAMFFQYPSGFGLARMGTAFDTMLRLLQERHGFERVHIVAHSMGGLVSRFAIQLNKATGHQYIDRFVSIATPWAGHPAAKRGVESSPVVVPNWRDMAPDSEFLEGIYQRPIEARFTLLFAFKGQTGMFNSEANDGVIPMKSALDPRAQSEAIEMFGFDEDHMSILESKSVREHVIRALTDG